MEVEGSGSSMSNVIAGNVSPVVKPLEWLILRQFSRNE